ncbi:TPA: NYN domain-containing protein [Clostridioides difficile]|nr:NYN domain-containing protein [Clostridioides difficile]
MKKNINHYLIIDGYNIINAWDNLKELAKEDLEDSREKVEKRKHITIVYTREHQTADSYIEKFITSLSKYDDVKVATNDYAEQQMILGKGATRMSARELKLELDRSKNKMKEKNIGLRKKIQRNWLEERLDKETLSKLENIRRKR